MRGVGLSVKKGEPFPCWQGEYPRIVLSPKNDLELKRAFAFAKEEGLKAVIAGMGGRLSWLERPKGGFLLIKTSLMQDIFKFDKANMTIEAGSGMPLLGLDAFLKDHGLFFPLDPFDLKGLSLGGAYQSHAFGGLSGSFGRIGELVLGVEVQSPGIERVHFGAHTIKNVSGYDLRRFLAGAFGEFGVVTRLILRVFPRPEAEMRVRFLPKSLDGLGGLAGLVSQESAGISRALFVGRPEGGWPELWAGFAGHGGLGSLKAERFRDRLVLEAVQAEAMLQEEGPFSLEEAWVEGFVKAHGFGDPDGFIGFGLEATLDVLKALKGLGGGYLVVPKLGRALVWGPKEEWLDRLKGMEGVRVFGLPFKRLQEGADDPKGRVLGRIKRVFDPEGLLGAGLIP